MSEEYDYEPIPGLPGHLPEGEKILWQGSPEAPRLARQALHVGAVGLYFAALAAWRVLDATFAGEDPSRALAGTGMLIGLGVVCVGLLWLYAMLAAKTTIYTITSKRVVLRIGVAIPKAINVPYTIIGSANLRADKDGGGDIALALTGNDRIGYLHLWPHARPWRMANPEPMLRALPDAQAVAVVLSEALRAAEAQRPAPIIDRADRPVRPVVETGAGAPLGAPAGAVGGAA